MDTIAVAEVIVTAPGRNYVTLKITTADGVVGWGDATLNGRELAVASYLRDHVVPLLAGRDPSRIEDIWNLLFKGAYWRRGPVTMCAIAAVDMALWDIKGKVAGLPVHQLLGGAVRQGVWVYTHASGVDVAELLDDVAAARDRGFTAIRAQAAVPGVAGTYGVKQGGAYEPANAALPEEQAWDSAAYLRFAPGYLGEVRAAVGADIELLHDVHHRLTPIEAARFGRSVEELGLFWLEDPTPADNQESLRLVRAHTTCPLAIGEVLTSIWDVQHLISQQLVDYVRLSVTHAGGISHLRKVFAFAELYQVRTGCHGPSDISPIGQAAAVQLDLATTNFGIQEYMGYPEAVGEVFRGGPRLADGYLWASDAPGLGIEFDEVAAARFEYAPRYLPVARRRDGTVHDW
jgi:mannonate dehydratase